MAVKQTQLLALELRVQETKVDIHHLKEIMVALGVVVVVMMPQVAAMALAQLALEIVEPSLVTEALELHLL